MTMTMKIDGIYDHDDDDDDDDEMMMIMMAMIKTIAMMMMMMMMIWCNCSVVGGKHVCLNHRSSLLAPRQTLP